MMTPLCRHWAEPMNSDRLSFPSILREPSLPSRPSDSATGAGEAAFAAIYSEAVQAANQEISQIVSADSPDSGSASPLDDPTSFLEFRAAASPFNACSPFTAMDGDFSVMNGELMQQVAAISLGHGPVATAGSIERESPAFSARDTTAIPASPAGQQTEGALSSGIHRLISWLDSHAHLHSAHHCAASVRQAMEAAGIPTGDRPPSGDAGDYGAFLLRHGAQVIPQESYDPKAGDIAVFDRTEDHPAGHIQVFDGQRWVSDFVQHTFSPYRDQESTPPVTVYRLS
jgi:hypothetical protein